MFLITTLIHRMVVSLLCMNLKLDVIIKVLNRGYSLCYFKSYYIKQRINKYFFFPRSSPNPPPQSLSISLYECSALLLSTSFVPKDPSQCYMPDWRQYPPAPSLCQEEGAFTC